MPVEPDCGGGARRGQVPIAPGSRGGGIRPRGRAGRARVREIGWLTQWRDAAGSRESSGRSSKARARGRDDGTELGGTGTSALAHVDQAVLLRLVHLAAGGLAGGAVRLLLTVGRHGAVWIVLVILVFVLGGRRGRRLAVTTAAALGVAAVLAELVLMGLVERAGPSAVLGSAVHVLVPNPAPFSFPCAVAALAFAAVPLLSRLGPPWAITCWLLALGIALAAVSAGQCFPSDALAGALTGLGSARVAVWALGEPLRRRGRVSPPVRRPAGG